MNYFALPGLIRRPLTIDAIKEQVLEYTGLTEQQIISKCRKRELVFARQLYIYYCRSFIADAHHEVIANFFRQKDHTSSVNAYQTISNYIFTKERAIMTAIREIDKELIRNNFILNRIRPLKN